MDGKGVKNLFWEYWYLIAGAIFIFLRLPSLFEPFTYGDEGIYLTLGQGIRQGLVLYRDIHDNKPPLIYLVAAMSESFAYYRLILFIWGGATVWIFYKLAAYLFGDRNQKSAIVSTLSFSFLTSLHMFEGNIGNAENFMLLPTLGGFWLILKSSQKNVLYYFFLAGILFSLATLFKVPAAFEYLSALAIIFLINYPTKRRGILISVSGFLLPILISFAYFASQNALNQYFSAAFAQNLPYLSSWGETKAKIGGFPLSLIARGLIVLGVWLFFFIFRAKTGRLTKIITVWFAFSSFAALLSSRPYPHYLIQILPSLSLALGVGITPKKRVFSATLTAILVLIFLIFRFWYYPNLPYLLNFSQYALGLKTQTAYFSQFAPQAEDIYTTAKFLTSHTQKGERVFIWGNDPYLYALSRRLPVGRYTVAYHIIDFNDYRTTSEALAKYLPRYLVVNESGPPPFPQLTNFISQAYFPINQFGPYRLFLRLPKSIII